MQAITAVRTTGIYCRPGCGARPNAGNVLTYATAAAAEADGYRACLLCRPYRSALAVPWDGPELVCRAVRLILAGALDDGSEADLGGRLGLSGRHLRRLFMAHLGVTPDGLARSARAHFARRLLDDTDLTITQIAYAAGFGSLRQFNRVCQATFCSSPRQLRDKRRSRDRLVADGGLALRLPYHGRLDWEAMIVQLAGRVIPGVEDLTDRTYRRTIVVGGHPGVLELSPGDDHLVLRLHLPHWEEVIHVAERARRIASLDFDPGRPCASLAADPLVGPLVNARPGLRPPGTWDAFEAGVCAIIGAETTPPRCLQVLGRLVEALGQPVTGLAQLGLHHTFPPPHVVAEADLAFLETSAAHTVGTFARAVAGDTVRLDGSIGLDPLVTALTGIEGIRTAVAHEIALRLGEPDAWPGAPSSTNSTTPGTVGGMEPSDEQAEQWRPWRALATTHLRHATAAERARVGA